jgi:hypothetical protein
MDAHADVGFFIILMAQILCITLFTCLLFYYSYGQIHLSPACPALVPCLY